METIEKKEVNYNSQLSDMKKNIDNLFRGIKDLNDQKMSLRKSIDMYRDKLDYLDESYQQEYNNLRKEELEKKIKESTEEIKVQLDRLQKNKETLMENRDVEISNIDVNDITSELGEELRFRDTLEYKLDEMIDTVDIALSPRLRTIIDEIGSRTPYVIPLETLEEISDTCAILYDEIDDMNIERSVDIANFPLKLKSVLSLDLDDNATIAVGAALILIPLISYFFLGLDIIGFVFLIAFVAMLGITVMRIISTAKALNMYLIMRYIISNLDTISTQLDKEIERVVNQRKNEIYNNFQNDIIRCNNLISDREQKIDYITQDLNDNFEPDATIIKKKIENSKKDAETNIARLKEEISYAEVELAEKIKDRQELLQKYPLIVDKVKSNFYSYDIHSFEKSEATRSGYILPRRIPYYTIVPENSDLENIMYFAVTRGRTLFIYNEDYEEDMFDFAKLLIYGLVMNMKPSMLQISIIETKYNCEAFTELDQNPEIPFYLNYMQDKDEKALKEEYNKEVVLRRKNTELKTIRPELGGCDRYNSDQIDNDSNPLDYRMLFEFDNENALSDVSVSKVQTTKFDAGMYHYIFQSEESLDLSAFERAMPFINTIYLFDKEDGIFKVMRNSEWSKYLEKLQVEKEAVRKVKEEKFKSKVEQHASSL